MKRSPILANFGQNVRRQREARELTQEALAEKAGLHPTYVSGIERGVHAACHAQDAVNCTLPHIDEENRQSH